MSEERPHPRPRRSVEATFREPGQVELIVGAPSGFHALSMYDHPEALIAQEGSGGVFSIFKRGDGPIIELKRRITKQVLQERGYEYSDSANLPREDILSLRAEVGRRLQAELTDMKPE